VLLLALAVRLVPLAAILANGGSPLIGDEGNYVEAALSLAHGGGIPDRWIWIRPPGYIAVAAAVFRLTADSLVALQLVQIVLSLLTIAATYALARVGSRQYAVGRDDAVVSRQSSVVSNERVDEGSGVGSPGAGNDSRSADNPVPNPKSKIQNPKSGGPKSKIQNPKSFRPWLAAAILAGAPSLVFATGLFLTETLFLLLITGLLWALVAYARATTPRGALGTAAAAGLLAGAALLTRASLIPVVLLALVLLARPPQLPRRLRAGAVAVFLAGLLGLLAPWTVRNAIHYGRFLPLDTAGYYAIWTGNTDLPLGQLRQAFTALPNLADRGNYALGQATHWALAHPDQFAGRALARVAAGVLPDNFGEAGYVLRDKLPGLPCATRDGFSFLVWWGWVLLAGAALVGWLRAPRDTLWWLAAGVVGVYLLTMAVTPPEFRYRYQLFSLLAVYAARVPFPPGARHGGGRRPAVVAWLLPVGAGVLWLVLALPTFWPDFVRAWDANQAIAAAGAARAAGDLPGAQRGYAQAARQESTCAAVRRDLGAVALQQQQPAGALAAWNDALAVEPGDWRTRALLADLLRRQGQPKRSAAIAREVPPTFNAALLDWAWDHLGATAPLTLTLGWDDVGFVRGFQIGEDAAEGPSFRWAGPGAHSSIRLRGGWPAGARVTLVMHSLAQTPPGPASRPATVTANGRPLAQLNVAPGWTAYPLDLPPDLAAAPEIVLAFDSPAQQASAADPRALSFALRSATITPLR